LSVDNWNATLGDVQFLKKVPHFHSLTIDYKCPLGLLGVIRVIPGLGLLGLLGVICVIRVIRVTPVIRVIRVT
jgi:hypothetical protein